MGAAGVYEVGLARAGSGWSNGREPGVLLTDTDSAVLRRSTALAVTRPAVPGEWVYGDPVVGREFGCWEDELEKSSADRVWAVAAKLYSDPASFAAQERGAV